MSLAIVALALASSAPKTGDGLPPGENLRPPLRAATNSPKSGAREATYRFVACVVDRHADIMRRVIEVGSPRDYERMSDRMTHTYGCPLMGYVGDSFETQFSSDQASIRGTIAEAFLKKAGNMGRFAPLPLAPSYQRPWFALTSRPGPIDEMATCTADIAPEAIVGLLNTKQDSREENAAIRELMPAIGRCLVKDYTLHADKLALRSALAEALYHRAFDPPPPSNDPPAQGSKQ
jgi:hypothetical protein